MTNIVHTVWKILDTSPSIRKNMALGLINNRALARYIIKEKKVHATLDAIMSAIRRYQVDKHDDIFKNAKNLLEKTINISTKSNLSELSLIKDTEVQKILPKLFNIIQYIRGDVLRVMQANESIRLLIDQKNLDVVVKLFPKEKIISIEKDISEINIFIHPKMQNTPGILAMLSNELAINGINIVEVMTCPPEMLFIVKKEDFQKASDIIHKLCQT